MRGQHAPAGVATPAAGRAGAQGVACRVRGAPISWGTGADSRACRIQVTTQQAGTWDHLVAWAYGNAVGTWWMPLCYSCLDISRKRWLARGGSPNGKTSLPWRASKRPPLPTSSRGRWGPAHARHATGVSSHHLPGTSSDCTPAVMQSLLLI